MPYCSRCGVEVEENEKNCPLCETPIQNLGPEPGLKMKKYPDEAVFHNHAILSLKQKKLIAFEVIMIVFAIIAIIIIFVNIVTQNHITWARFPLLSIGLIVCLSTFGLLIGNVVLIILFEVLSMLAFLFLVDLFSNWKIDWFYDLALPIICLVSIVTVLLTLLVMFAKKRGANLAAYFLFGIGFLSLGLDLIITSYLDEIIRISWSFWVALPTGGIGLLLLYFHHRLSNVIDIKRRFQL